MHSMKFLSLFISVVVLGACSSPADRASKAQEQSFKAQGNIATERLDLVAKYQDCVEKASNDRQKIEACDSYLKAAEALK